MFWACGVGGGGKPVSVFGRRLLDVTHVSAALISLLSGLYNFTQMRVRKQNCLITLSLSLYLSLFLILSFSLSFSFYPYLCISLSRFSRRLYFRWRNKPYPTNGVKKPSTPKSPYIYLERAPVTSDTCGRSVICWTDRLAPEQQRPTHFPHYRGGINQHSLF